MPFSYAQYAGNGSATTFSVPFPYLLKAHVKLFYGFNLVDGTFTSELVDGVGFAWTSGTQVQTTVAPAVGQTLTIVRQTPSNALVVQWQDGSNLIAGDLIDSSLQTLYAVQEQEDAVLLASAQSASAATAATAAVTTANAASTTANGIAGTANTALSNSSAAVATANAASATATAAQTTANGIAGTANTALSNSSAAVSTANAAQTTANGIAGTANTALSNSSAAVTTANAAQTTANGIAATANTALSNSSAAVTTANTAQSTANTALSNAAAAQSTANSATSAAAAAQSTANSATSAAAAAQGTANSATSAAAAAQGTADAALPKAGGTMTGVITYATAQPRLVLGTVVAPATATSVDFLSIPSWAKRITVNLVGISTNGTSAEIIRIGDSSGFSASSYVGTTSFLAGGVSPTFGVNVLSDGFNLMGQSASTPTNVLTGKVTIEYTGLVGGINYWVASGVISRIDNTVFQKFVAGYKGLTGTLDRVQLTTITGTASFDGGLVNIIYEG